MVTDIGSGLNADRRGLRQLLSWAKEREISDIAVATEDRLVYKVDIRGVWCPVSHSRPFRR